MSSLHPTINLHRLAEEAVAGAIGRGLTVATAESLTAGMVAAMLADTPGASGMLQGGVVSYQNTVKADVLGVSRELLETVGAVDGRVAEAMAAGARRICGADVGDLHYRGCRPRAARRQGRGFRFYRRRHGGGCDVVRLQLRGQPAGNPRPGLCRRAGTAP